jgi:GH25 family lysozyme M1 (1,4-beta-N-acetylmuramidase)
MNMELRAYLEQQLEVNDNIVAVGEGKNGSNIVFVLDDAPDVLAPSALPDNVTIIKVKGFGVGPPYWNDVVEPSVYNDRMRPVPGGPSVGNWRITAGTVSGYVTDNRTGDKVLLSNWHVLQGDSGQIGDEIIQPGMADGGTRPNDVVANLRRSVPVHTDLTVFVDCAIAGMKDQSNIDENIIALGKPHGVVSPHVGDWLKKSGRSSETTAGGLAVVNASVKVNYGNFSKTVQDCIITGVPSAPGDSGSMMLNYSNQAVGLLFAGGSTSDGYLITVGCRADRVEDELDVTFPTPNPLQKRSGIDVSKWQGEMDWNVAVDAGVNVAVIRAGSIDNVTGIPYEDTQFRRNAELAPPLMPVGYYWYFRPNWSSTVQANFFCDLIKNVSWKVPPVIDIEENAGMSKNEVASAVWSFANQIEQQTGVRPIIYTNPGFWNAYVGPTTWAKNYPLWVANWVNLGVLVPLLPDDWKGISPVMWQYRVFKGGGSVYGAKSADIDLDVTYPPFEGILVGNEPPPPPDYVTLEIVIDGQGFVNPSGGQYPVGTTVQLQAAPETGWKFTVWDGDIDGSSNPVSILMDEDKTVIANFVKVEEDELAVFEHYKGKVVTTKNLNYRKEPKVTGTLIGYMPPGTIVEILGTTKDSSGNDWVRIGYAEWAAQLYGGVEYIHYLLESEL